MLINAERYMATTTHKPHNKYMPHHTTQCFTWFGQHRVDRDHRLQLKPVQSIDAFGGDHVQQRFQIVHRGVFQAKQFFRVRQHVGWRCSKRRGGGRGGGRGRRGRGREEEEARQNKTKKSSYRPVFPRSHAGHGTQCHWSAPSG